MNKLVKIALSIVAFVVVLVLAGGAILGLFVDPNDYKQEIEQAALENADLELQIEGDIGWSIYPSIGLDIAKIKAGYPNQETLASLDSANISVDLMPLFSSELKMKTLTIKGLNLNLVKDANSTNWQATSASIEQKGNTSSSSSEPSSNTADQNSSDSTEQLANKIDIESIVIVDANIRYSDTEKGETTSIKNFNLTTDRIQLGKAFNGELDFALEIAKNQQKTLSASASLSANFLLDHVNQRYQISSLKSQLKLITDKQVDLSLNADIIADMAAQNVSISKLQVTAGDLKATGAVQLKGPELAQLSGQLAIATFDLKNLLAALKLAPISTSDDSALRALSLNTEFSGDAKQISINKLQLAVDDTNISGTAKVNLASTRIAFNLKGDQIALDKYLPKAAAQSAGGSTSNSQGTGTAKSSPAQGKYSKEIIIPVEPLRTLNMQGKLTFNQIRYQKTVVKNLSLSIDANKGLVKIPALNLQVYGGSIANSIALDARKKPLILSLVNNTKALQLGPVLADYASTDMLTGALTSSSKLTATGQSVHSIVNSLNGKVKLNLADGVIKGINAVQTMCETVNKVASLGGTVAPTQAVDKTTPFASINGNLAFKNGVMSNKDFKADLDAININGKGSVNLPKQTLNYRVGLNIQDNLFKKSCSVNNKIQGIEWPVDCKGSFSDDPMKLCKPDLSVVKDILKKALKDKLEKKLGVSVKAKKAELKKKVEEKKEELKQKVEDQVKDKLKGALKGLF
jgi:AsmA protein